MPVSKKRVKFEFGEGRRRQLLQRERLLAHGLSQAVDENRNHVPGQFAIVAGADVGAAPTLPQAFTVRFVVDGDVDAETAGRYRLGQFPAVGVQQAAAGGIEKVEADPRRFDARLVGVVAQLDKPVGAAAGPGAGGIAGFERKGQGRVPGHGIALLPQDALKILLQDQVVVGIIERPDEQGRPSGKGLEGNRV